jgi:hypothetical protein
LPVSPWGQDEEGADREQIRRRIREIQAGKVKEVPMVDVVSKLEKVAAENPRSSTEAPDLRPVEAPRHRQQVKNRKDTQAAP